MAQRGRKCKYEELIEPKLDEIAAKIESGETEKQVAKDMHICPSTWKEYKKEISGFSGCYKKSTQTRNAAIVNALYRQAVGGYVTETKAKTLNKSRSYTDKDGKKVCEKFQEIEMVKETRYVDGNATSAIFLAKNFMPDEFCDNPQKIDIDRAKLRLEELKAEKNDFKI